jgi:hypothetical protein
MEEMKLVSLIFVAALLVLGAEGAKEKISGKLLAGNPAYLLRDGGKKLELTGDKDTLAVLADERLTGAEMEILGHFDGSGKFWVDPIHTKAMRVHRHGKKLLISYWCDVCSIRTYAPGKCMCCQEETELDLAERFDP